MPLPDPPDSDPAVRSGPTELPEAGCRILLVDDDPFVRNSLLAVLQRAGCTVVAAENGKVALSLLAKQTFDWLVTDLVMPEMEGMELIRAVRLTHPQLRILAMSGGGRVAPCNYLPMARLLGAHRVLEKPFLFADLLAVLRDSTPAPVPGSPLP
ncbi:MAG: response regulator [Verrucomicrobia bacterium]|nr:response regulator [Verrucomicrobiota bacterium]